MCPQYQNQSHPKHRVKRTAKDVSVQKEWRLKSIMPFTCLVSLSGALKSCIKSTHQSSPVTQGTDTKIKAEFTARSGKKCKICHCLATLKTAITSHGLAPSSPNKTNAALPAAIYNQTSLHFPHLSLYAGSCSFSCFVYVIPS